MKYYYSNRAASPILGGKNQYNFEVTSSSNGMVSGVLASDVKENIAELDKLVEQKRVISITKEVYDLQLKKKRNSSTPLTSTRTAEAVEGYRPSPKKVEVLEDAERAVEELESEIKEEQKPAIEHTSDEAEAPAVIDEEPAPAPKPKRERKKKD